MADNLVIGVASVIDDDVTTTDELIPSGETSSYRSNPYRLSRFALSRRDPEYAHRTDAFRAGVREAFGGEAGVIDKYASLEDGEASAVSADIATAKNAVALEGSVGFGTLVCALRPGDGSAREQAASCQRVLGGSANIAREYATKRYRSNLINWGMLPLLCDTVTIGRDAGTDNEALVPGDMVILPKIREAVSSGASDVQGFVWHKATCTVSSHKFSLGQLTDEERAIILAGSLVNHYRGEK